MKKENLEGKVFIFRGLVATSKSTTAEFLQDILIINNIKNYLLKTDDVRKLLLSKDKITYSEEQRLWVYQQMAIMGRNLMTHGITVIYDAACETKTFLDTLQKNLPEGIIPILIETFCPEPISIERILKREEENLDLSDGGVNQYYKVKANYQQLPSGILIDTSGTRDDIKLKLEIALDAL
jgi:adenylylsulfate kinase-like enzyme